MDLCLSKSTNQVPTRYSDNIEDSDSIIDLMFLRPNSLKIDNHTIYPEWRYLLNHTLLTVSISIDKEHISTKRHIIIKNSKEENSFVAELIDNFRRLDTRNISSKIALDQIIQKVANKTDSIWFKHSKLVNITKHLKTWWNKDYQTKLAKYKTTKQVKN